MGTALSRSESETDLHAKAAVYGLRSEAVDGMDVLAVRDAALRAQAHCRAGGGPYILEILPYRYRGHAMSDPAKYRTKEEVDK
jgi:pyruvate dehydrogenase E1 component alpha subunit